MTLDELKIGESATVTYVGGSGSLRQHFLEMVHNKFSPVFMRFFRALKHYETLN